MYYIYVSTCVHVVFVNIMKLRLFYVRALFRHKQLIIRLAVYVSA